MRQVFCRPLGGRVALSLLALAAVASSTACTAQSFCNKRAECLADEADIELEDDSIAVCVAEFDASINTLRANEEDDCQQLADATVALRACQAGLKCDDFFESDLGGECDDQLDDFEDAQEDAAGSQCTAQD
jgi:hypothetical protein